ncbi:HAD family phosphatase [Fusibacter sp. 3D3]|uniref:HAD family hydrolase n=1 Tax=Fusibacter sp. 3D3 TaxID=1048380 RepID=UPI0008539415|nr:HAD family phosphatase [Fusibacter sp. 3D3]GAU78496.1 phosphoserine phosphatase [Fusibacter sp. 3D3]
MQKIKLVCFDLDDTLIRETHSVMIPCIINNKEMEHNLIQQKEISGTLDYITADFLRAELLCGLEETKIKEGFLQLAKPLQNISETISQLHQNNIKCIVVTVGPIQVAKVVSALWGFDSYYGSEYEVLDGMFTGKITKYVNSEQKIECLKDYCSKTHIDPSECISVGDGATDIPVFKFCGKSIALNASEKVKKEATYWIDTSDLLEILKVII